ncbi:MAG TPA: DUF3311 domain-containing protein [Gemmatimonadales bacterium]|nr:DUF3311 domain-containing protein [Gemmatimonadales bacterium]
MKPEPDRPGRAGWLPRLLVYALFLLVVVVSLWVPLYNRAEPSIAGIPFFYWFQILWIVASAAAVAIAYRLDV